MGGVGGGSEMETDDVVLVKDVIYTHRLCLCNVRINVQVTLMRGLEEKRFVGGAIMYVCGGRGTTTHVCVCVGGGEGDNYACVCVCVSCACSLEKHMSLLMWGGLGMVYLIYAYINTLFHVTST